MSRKDELLKDIKFTIIPRRVTIIVFLLLSVLLKLTHYANIPYRSILWLFLWFLTTLPFEWIIKKLKTKESVENFQFLYFLIEFFLLTVVIHYFGGITWIGGVFYVFTIIYGNILLSRKKAICLILLGVLIFDSLIVLEFFNFLPHYVLFAGKDFYTNNPDLIDHIIVNAVVMNILLLSVGIFLNTLGNLLRKKREQLKKAYLRIEEERIVLAVKVSARTDEAREVSEKLKDKVGESTKSLKDKIAELEKFNKLTRGREERLRFLAKKLNAREET